LIFAFGGYEVIGVPAGEATDPRQHVPFASLATIIAVTAIMALVQMVALGTLPHLATASTPLADASLQFMGTGGALLISLGAVVSMIGNSVGQILAGSRLLFALAEHGELPRFFGTIHPRYRTPATAVLFTTVVALALALAGSFAILAVASAAARLISYAGTCAATLKLRQPRFRGVVKAASFVIPMGRLVPLLGIGVSLLILAGASRQQLLGGALALITGGAFFLANNRGLLLSLSISRAWRR
jgi:amino acid transporter